MKKGILVMMLVVLMGTPLASYAETKEKCEVKCIDRCGSYNKNDKDFNNCMSFCMAECLPGKPTSSRNLPDPSQTALDSSMPCAEAYKEKESVTKNIVVATARDDNDLPCYAGGKYMGNCSRNKPYYNVFSGECYPTLHDCKKADGDLSSAQVSSGCVRCGR